MPGDLRAHGECWDLLIGGVLKEGGAESCFGTWQSMEEGGGWGGNRCVRPKVQDFSLT